MKTPPRKTKLLTALLTLCMVLSLVPLSAFAADLTVSNEAELIAALENADCSEIKLGASIATTQELVVNRTVTLDLNGYTLSCNSSGMDMILVGSSGNLTVKDSGTDGRIDGRNVNCGFEVKGGTLILESGSIVNCRENGDGGAVDVSNTGVAETPIKYGQFVMNGGAIMDCLATDDAGAVDIGSGCTFIMNGGTISNCRADDDGGAVFIKSSGYFVMNGGTIENCSAHNNGGAVNIYENGSFTMTGGTIKSCRVDLGGHGDAVYGENDEAVVTMTGGTFEDCGESPYSFNGFTVTFDSDGGSTVPEQKLRNAPAVKPADPTKDGYDFAGWYLGDAQYAFDTNVTSNITLKAHWTSTTGTTAITSVKVEYKKPDYKPDDTPYATASVTKGGCTVAYEYWREIYQATEGGVWQGTGRYWYSDPNKMAALAEDERITAFEAGHSYSYNIVLVAKNGYFFSGDETVVSVGGYEWGKPDYNTNLEVKDMSMELHIYSPYRLTLPSAIPEAAIENVKFDYQPGDAPQATAVVPAAATDQYEIVYECWQQFENNNPVAAWYSDNGSHGSLPTIAAFEGGKSYVYSLMLKPKDGYTFSSKTAITVNGQKISAPFVSGAMYIPAVKTIAMPAPAEKYTVTYTDGVDGEEIFKDQTYTVEAGKATPAFNGTPARDGYTFTGWSPAVAATVTGNAAYTAQWEKAAAAATGNATNEATWKAYAAATPTPTSENKPSAAEATIPQTGDTGNVLLWLALLFISGGAAMGTAVASRKKSMTDK